MKKLFLVLFSVTIPFSACTVFEQSYSEKQFLEMEARLSKVEADNLTIKFKLGLNDTKIETKKEPEIKPVEAKEPEVKPEPEVIVVPKKFELTEPKEGANLTVEPITFKGNVDSGATKISVKYTGIDYTEEYTLQNFKENDLTFWYKASTSFKNLAKGKNSYEFTAEFKDGDKVTLPPIVINYK